MAPAPTATAVVAERRIEVDALLLDKDGTLFDFHALWGGWARALAEAIAERLDGDVTAAQLLAALGSHGDGRHDPHGPLVAGSLSEVRAVLAGCAYRSGVDWPRARAAVDAAEDGLEGRFSRSEHVQLRAGAVTLLESAQGAGLGCALVTTDVRAAAVADLEAAGIAGAFAVVVGDDDVARGKPAPDPALTACAQLGVAPAQALLLGDTANDVRAGRAAGLAAVIGVADAAAPAEHLADADAVIHDLSEVRLSPRLVE